MVASKVTLLSPTAKQGRVLSSSLNTIVVRLSTVGASGEFAVNTASWVSKLLPHVSKVAGPSAGAVHVVQRDAAVVSNGLGSFPSRLAPTLLAVAVPEEPAITPAEAKVSSKALVTGAAARGLPPVTMNADAINPTAKADATRRRRIGVGSCLESP